MNTNFTIDELTTWIADLMTSAKNDESFPATWFKPTEDSPIAIVGGWMNGFSPRDTDLFCMSKSEPTFAMCVKIIENKEHYAYPDFATLSMPVEVSGEVDDTCQILEWEDDPEAFATFFWGEWQRMLETWECGGYC